MFLLQLHAPLQELIVDMYLSLLTSDWNAGSYEDKCVLLGLEKHMGKLMLVNSKFCRMIKPCLDRVLQRHIRLGCRNDRRMLGLRDVLKPKTILNLSVLVCSGPKFLQEKELLFDWVGPLCDRIDCRVLTVRYLPEVAGPKPDPSAPYEIMKALQHNLRAVSFRDCIPKVAGLVFPKVRDLRIGSQYFMHVSLEHSRQVMHEMSIAFPNVVSLVLDETYPTNLSAFPRLKQLVIFKCDKTLFRDEDTVWALLRDFHAELAASGRTVRLVISALSARTCAEVLPRMIRSVSCVCDRPHYPAFWQDIEPYRLRQYLTDENGCFELSVASGDIFLSNVVGTGIFHRSNEFVRISADEAKAIESRRAVSYSV